MASIESIILGEVPEEVIANMFIRNNIDIHYDEVESFNNNQKFYIEDENRVPKYIYRNNLTTNIEDVESNILRTPNTTPYSGQGFYADNYKAVLGSATGPGISWDGENLYFRGIIQSGAIIDPALKEELMGPEGPAGEDGLDGNDGTSFNFKGVLSFLSDLEDILYPTQNDAWRITETNEVWVYNGVEWVNMGQFQGPQGPAGLDGSDGEPFLYLGELESEDDLALLVDPVVGNAYKIGIYLYVYNGTSWDNMGPYSRDQKVTQGIVLSMS